MSVSWISLQPKRMHYAVISLGGVWFRSPLKVSCSWRILIPRIHQSWIEIALRAFKGPFMSARFNKSWCWLSCWWTKSNGESGNTVGKRLHQKILSLAIKHHQRLQMAKILVEMMDLQQVVLMKTHLLLGGGRCNLMAHLQIGGLLPGNVFGEEDDHLCRVL